MDIQKNMKILINANEIEAIEGEKLIEVALRNGVEIPALCYARGYKHQPSCMMCVVKECKTGQFIPACSTLVSEGMEIETDSEEVMELRKMSLELLLSDHIAVCHPPCQPKNCKLRKYANVYKAKWNKYPNYSAIKEAEPQHIKGNLWFDVTKCIRCGLCVYNSTNGFTFKERGFGMHVVLPEESVNNVDEILWNICPTQALYQI
jgi:NADH dehydrogenase/NADH:ubiquinone oxidoreductase subunit G